MPENRLSAARLYLLEMRWKLYTWHINYLEQQNMYNETTNRHANPEKGISQGSPSLEEDFMQLKTIKRVIISHFYG